MRNSLVARIYRHIPILRELVSILDALTSIRHLLKSIQRQVDNQHSLSVIRLLDFGLEKHPRYNDPKRLLRYAFQACSQNGEDGMIREIFKRIGVTSKTFVEMGVGDGDENNSAFLISQGWRGTWIDGNAAFLTAVKQRGWDRNAQINGVVSMISKDNVESLLRTAGVGTEFDLLSIDLDQNTYHIWSALRAFRPRVVVVEFNAAFPPEMEWIVPYNAESMWNGSQNFGASLKSFELLGEELGFNLVGCDFCGVNAFFVRKDLCRDLFASPFTAEHHYEPLRYAALTRRGHPAEAFDSSAHIG